MKNGCCKFGSLCKFNHPQPFSDAVPLSSSAVTPIHSPAGQLSFPSASVVSRPSYALPQQTISVPSWNACNVSSLMINPHCAFGSSCCSIVTLLINILACIFSIGCELNACE